jgi:hypothetical protein
MPTARMSERCFVREEFLKEAIPEEYSGGHPESLVVTDQTGRIRADFSVGRTQVRISGKKAGHNNSSQDPLLAKQNFVFPGELSPCPPRGGRFSSRRPPGGCERGGVWSIPTGRRREPGSSSPGTRMLEPAAADSEFLQEPGMFQEPQSGAGRRVPSLASRKAGALSL